MDQFTDIQVDTLQVVHNEDDRRRPPAGDRVPFISICPFTGRGVLQDLEAGAIQGRAPVAPAIS